MNPQLLSTIVTIMGILDGSRYCREIQSKGMPDQPSEDQKHCISFYEGQASDDALSFFGHGPTFEEYEVHGKKVIFGSAEYVLSRDRKTLTTIRGTTTPGVVFTKE